MSGKSQTKSWNSRKEDLACVEPLPSEGKGHTFELCRVRQ